MHGFALVVAPASACDAEHAHVHALAAEAQGWLASRGPCVLAGWIMIVACEAAAVVAGPLGEWAAPAPEVAAEASRPFPRALVLPHAHQ